ncbi:MAG: T9SS type A sorting domain-containing protein [Clostridia bacterium]|nr:T9SS type A sorting domain-containing protein [Clostridia bacterium]
MKKYLLVLFSVIFTYQLAAQSQRWEIKIGDSYTTENFKAIAECYDQGYKVLTWKGNQNGHGTALKTDKNGNLLYEKIFDHLEGGFNLMAIVEDSSGNFYIGGFFTYHKNLPFVMKFNACGEQEWCKHIVHGFGGGVMDLVINKNNQLIALIYWESGDTGDQIYLVGFDLDGHELWKNAYAKKSDYPLTTNPVPRDLLYHNDEYYISGDVYWPYPDDPYHVYQRQLFIGITSTFKEKFMVPFYALDSIWGKAYSCIPINDSVIMGVGIRRYYSSRDITILSFISTDGKELGYSQILNEQIGPNINNNYTHDIVRINDSLFLAAVPFGEDLSLNPVGELVIDAAGNVYKIKSHPNTQDKPAIIKTRDQEYLVGTNFREGNDSDIYLYKFDDNLQSVSYDTTQRVYDSLCPHPIESGILDLTECLVVTDIEELPGPEEYYESIRHIPIKVHPNPVKDGRLTLEFENTQHHQNMQLRCYDSFGRQLHSQKIYKGQQETKLDVSAWSAGMYVAVIYSDGGACGKVKFVVE